MEPSLRKLVNTAEKNSFYQLLGIRVEEVRKGYARLSIEVEEKHIQFQGAVHGGVIASLADSAAAWAAYGSGITKGTPVTVEMKINFLRSVKAGRIVAEAANVHEGSRIFVSDVLVRDGEELPVAKSLVTYYIVGSERT